MRPRSTCALAKESVRKIGRRVRLVRSSVFDWGATDELENLTRSNDSSGNMADEVRVGFFPQILQRRIGKSQWKWGLNNFMKQVINEMFRINLWGVMKQTRKRKYSFLFCSTIILCQLILFLLFTCYIPMQ